MASNPFFSGLQQGIASRRQSAALARDEMRNRGMEALAEEFGEEAFAPGERATLRATDRADQQFAAREEQRALENARRAELDARAIEEQDRQRRLGAVRNVVQAFRSGLDSGGSPEEVTSRLAPIMSTLGITNDEITALPQQLAQDPTLLDQFEDVLTRQSERRAVGRPVAVRNADGTTALLQNFSDGSSEVIEGVTPLEAELAQGRLDVSRGGLDVRQQRLQQTGAEGRREIERAEAVGRAEGERDAEDLPPSAAEVRRATRIFNAFERDSDILEDNIDIALEQSDGIATTGLFSLLDVVPGTPAADLAETMNTVLSDAAFSQLEEMKAQSATGASGLGQVTVREIELLQDSIVALGRRQTKENFQRNLRTYKERLASVREAVAAEQEDLLDRRRQFTQGPSVNVPEANLSDLSDERLEQLLQEME